jgi:hypothetical protein
VQQLSRYAAGHDNFGPYLYRRSFRASNVQATFSHKPVPDGLPDVREALVPRADCDGYDVKKAFLRRDSRCPYL